MLALLVYLAVTQQPQRRDSLGALFWPESGQTAARASLRRELYGLRQIIGDGWLLISRETIEINPDSDVWIDVTEFKHLAGMLNTASVTAATLDAQAIDNGAQAIALYQADFLAGFTLSDSPEFDDWQFFVTDALHREVAGVLEKFVHFYESQSDYKQAITYARRWLALDVMHEPVHRALMRVYALAGQRAAAQRQYDNCVRILDDALGVPPEAETTQLYEAIRKRQFPGSAQVSLVKEQRTGNGQTPTTHTPLRQITDLQYKHNLPPRSNTFVGRKDELAAIRHLLAEEDDCRLLTLRGPGGIGKTRLAIEVAAGLLNEFPDGICFVSFASIDTECDVIPAIADALHFSFGDSNDPETQLHSYLHTKKLLLLVDNLEHLLHAADLIARLLQETTAVKVLATSREVLGLQEEWLYPVAGLSVPIQATSLAHLETNSAVQLFIQRARRADANFALTNESMDPIVRICRLLDGMPLGLELAAAWVRTLSCAEIADEIEQGIDILATSLRNVPPRHRSLRAVFEQTWQRLSEHEREILKRLAIFRDLFTREAAQQLANASLFTLSSLVDKSLCRQQAGRYGLHELLRQFAFEQMTEEEQHAAQQEQSRYFGTLLEAHQQHVMTAREEELIRFVADNYNNILAAWHYLLGRIQIDSEADECASLLGIYLFALTVYFYQSTSYWQGVRIIQAAIDSLQKTAAPQLTRDTAVRNLYFELQIKHAGLRIYLGGLQELKETAKANLLTLIPTLRSQANERQLANALYSLGQVHAVLGDGKEAEQCWTEAVVLYDHLGLQLKSTGPMIALGVSKSQRKAYDEALVHFEKAADIYQELAYAVGLARCLNDIGTTYMLKGDIQQAIARFEQACPVARKSNHPLWLGTILCHLGICTRLMDNHEASSEKFAEALTVFRELWERQRAVVALVFTSLICVELNDLQAASQNMRQLLGLVQNYQQGLNGIRALAVAALLLERMKQFEPAVAIATHALADTRLYGLWRMHCQSVLDNMAGQMNQAAYAAAQVRGRTVTFEEMIEEAFLRFDPSL